ncbi:MAG: dockerin type I repeat-containing protein [candidate division Zixibacteria bacterium]|nr:dockerin type I repeat-containing protein [candidate division Zixibacteria bacterium]
MSLTSQSSRIAATMAAVIIMAALLIAPAIATPVLEVRIPDTLVTTDSSAVWVDVFMTNTADSVAGFSIAFQLDMPDLIEFMTERGAPVVDTAGSLISGWRLVATSLIGGSPHMMKIVAMANNYPEPAIPSIGPRTDPGLLFRMMMKIYPYTPETLPDRIVHLMINEMLSETAFSDQTGVLIGVTTIVDTSYDYWHCTEWLGDSCLNWVQVSIPEEGDSTSMEIKPHSVLDTSLVHYQFGTMRVVPLCHGICGDANDDGKVNVADAVYIVSYVFRGGPWPIEDKCADPNNDYKNNVGDAIFLINHIFRSGDCPDCTPH